MNPTVVSFKGTREGLRISLGEGGWQELLKELAAQLDRPGAQSFFRGARVVLETGDRSIDLDELEGLIKLLAEHEMTLCAWSGDDQAQQEKTNHDSNSPFPEPKLPEAAPSTGGPSAPEGIDSGADRWPSLLIRRTVRSGQKINYPGTVIVVGDVNPGAEVIAEGDVLVWGKLRGVVHAGAAGDDNAMVGALILAPTQLRIGSQIARAPDDKRARFAPAEVARVRSGQIIVEPWDSL